MEYSPIPSHDRNHLATLLVRTAVYLTCIVTVISIAVLFTQAARQGQGAFEPEVLGALAFFWSTPEAIVRHDAVIYQYVGDEVVLTWKKEEGLAGGACLRTFYDYDETLRARHSHYRSNTGSCRSSRRQRTSVG